MPSTMRSFLPGCLFLAAIVIALLTNTGTTQAAGNSVLVTGEVEVADSKVSPENLIVSVHAGFRRGICRRRPDATRRVGTLRCGVAAATQ